ncbi:hypothetical protein M407DRAFT_12435 [Tulasnella calospora MUT 4182]|uniref:Uncharacterized protein n=1 Tax=Tulasnella calospora MUT 4182 TaxID=1051891 RepID=A0A0C3K751_9AGAM|nr:hypothetical protein M407DRAFT_12435 [Tulasnella calospora MUT 4182]
MSSALSSSKRNSSFANLATAAVSLFGLGGLGGLTMTAASPSKSPSGASEVPEKTLAPVVATASAPEKELARGRSRASSRAQASHQLLGASTSIASSSSLVEMSKAMASGGSRLPISMSTADMQVAKRPLGPLPKDLEDKLRGSTQARYEGPKQPLTVDVSGKRKEKEKEREEGPMTSPPPTSSTTRSKDSPHSAAPPKSAWDPDLVRDLKESRRLSREASYHGTHPNISAYGAAGNVVHPVNPFLPSSPGSPTSPTSRPGYPQHRRRTTSHSQSKSHSRSHSTATVAEEEGGDKDAPLPRVKSNQSITSMTTSSSRRARHSSREPPSPSATVYSIAGPSAPRIPRGMSMTSLSGQGFGIQNRGSMYGNPVSPGGQPGQGSGAALPRTASQPYMNRWTSGSSGAGGSAFGSPNGPTPPGTVYFGHYGPNHPHNGPYGPIVPPLQPLQPLPPPLNRAKSREAPKASGPMYPVLALPTERRKKMVKKTVVNEDGHEVEVDGEEEEDVYTKPKRLFYFDR